MSIAYVNQRIACKAVIHAGSKVLVLREASTYEEGTQTTRWGFPGGRINPGEPFLDGLRREVAEETGLKITAMEPLYVGEWFPVIKGEQNQIVAVFFACTLSPENDAGSVQLSDEHDAYKWIGAADAKTVNFMSPDDDVLATYFNKFAK